MSRLSLATLALCGLLGACTETRASFGAGAGAAMPVGAVDTAPASFIETCVKWPELCGVPSEGTASADAAKAPGPPDAGVLATTNADAGQAITTIPNAAAVFDDAKARRLLQRVNNEVNGLMARDLHLLVNLADDWTPARRTADGLVGDCKSFAAEKRHRLLAAGFPPGRLFYAVVFRPDIGLHALLMAHLDEGDFALDNRQPWVVPWRDAPYVYVLRQDAKNPLRWRNLVVSRALPSVERDTAPIVLASQQNSPADVRLGSR